MRASEVNFLQMGTPVLLIIPTISRQVLNGTTADPLTIIIQVGMIRLVNPRMIATPIGRRESDPCFSRMGDLPILTKLITGNRLGRAINRIEGALDPEVDRAGLRVARRGSREVDPATYSAINKRRVCAIIGPFYSI